MTDHITDPYLNRAALAAPRGVPTRAVPCAACMAAPGEPCTGLYGPNGDRVPITNLHWARVPRESYPSRYGVGVADAGEGFGAAL